MNKQDDHYTGALLEEMRDQYAKIVEMLSLMTGMPIQVKETNERLKVVEQDVKVIKHVLTDHSKTLWGHEGRITVLEAA